ncbi:hypothetical protein AAVH_20298 [Aphelenchoides avenae]|nr:hypothetical protein AAVH_20298 [Aphelenchus avenae]
MPDILKPEVDAVVRLVALYIDDHDDQFLAAWEQARAELADAFLQEFFDACAEAVRTFRNDLQEWRSLFEAGSYRESYLPLRRLDEDLTRRTSDNMISMEKYAAVRDTRTLIICAAEIETFRAEGREYTVRASSMDRSEDAYRLAQTINSQAAATNSSESIKCAEAIRTSLDISSQGLSRCTPAGTRSDEGMCRAKARIEDDVMASLSQKECDWLKNLANALRMADAHGFTQLLQNDDLRLGNFMHDFLITLSAELTNALGTLDQALELQASGKLDELCALIKDLHSTCSRAGLWFHALRVQISAFVARAPPEVRWNLRQTYDEGRELENCDDIEALSIMHDSWGYECLSRRKFDAAGRHFEKALRAYESNATATGFLGAAFLALTSLVNGETSAYDESIARFDRWLPNKTKATLRRFYDAYMSEDIVDTELVVAILILSNNTLARVADHYASVRHNKLQLRSVLICITQLR